MWCLSNDNSKAVITAAEQIHSAHRECLLQLPETAVVFFMSKGTDYLVEHYDTENSEHKGYARISSGRTVKDDLMSSGS